MNQQNQGAGQGTQSHPQESEVPSQEAKGVAPSNQWFCTECGTKNSGNSVVNVELENLK